MINMINWLEHWLQGDNTKILYILALILIANMIDFLLGWVNAKFNNKVSFSSSKAIYGIARKMILFIVLVFFIPVAMLVPYPVGIGALYVLFLGYLLSEINSILSHLRLTEDEKKSELFADFVQRIFNQNNKGGN
jgi:toxin secretion/phage lysis holin